MQRRSREQPSAKSCPGSTWLKEEFIRGKVTLIGCPKLDGVDYTEKLTEIIANNL